MEYRQVYRAVCRYAAEHLDSLEIFEEFEDDDYERVERAILEIQGQLLRKAGLERRGESDDRRGVNRTDERSI